MMAPKEHVRVRPGLANPETINRPMGVGSGWKNLAGSGWSGLSGFSVLSGLSGLSGSSG